MRRAAPNPYGVAGFALAAAFAIVQKWTLPEFCWSTWLAGLFFAWTCVIGAGLRIILTARSEKARYEARLPFLRRVPPVLFLPAMIAVAAAAGLIAFRLYAFLFGFYGLFLSVFAEMEPVRLFGRNGFINSDFFTPVAWLADRYWPMALGLLVADWKAIFGPRPWKRLLLPLQAEILRMHVLILALPFFSLLAWAVFDTAYQPVTIVLLMGLICLLPEPGRKDTA